MLVVVVDLLHQVDLTLEAQEVQAEGAQAEMQVQRELLEAQIPVEVEEVEVMLRHSKLLVEMVDLV